MINYTRVLPRDLFNEAKLLKCLGQLALFIHDGVDHKRQRAPKKLKLRYEGNPFVIGQNQGDGSFYCETVRLYYARTEISLSTSINSRDNFPLYASWDEEEVRVFDEDGNFNITFLDMLTTIRG